MASPLPEPFELVDILGDGEILTCRAELRGDEVLVHVLPADPAGRDRIFARIARLPRSPFFLDRIEHQGHSLVVTTSRPELEDFEGYLDRMAPEAGAEEEPEPSRGEATRLVLNIRAHVKEEGAGADTSEEAASDATEPVPEARPAEAPADGESPTVELPAMGSPPDEAPRPDPADRPTPPMTPGMLGVPDAWSTDEQDEDQVATGGHAAMRADGEADTPPAGSARPPGDRGRADDAPTLEPAPAPELPDDDQPRPQLQPMPPEAPPREATSKPASDPPTRKPEPAPAAESPPEEKPRRRTQLFLSAVPPGGFETAEEGEDAPPPEPKSPGGGSPTVLDTSAPAPERRAPPEPAAPSTFQPSPWWASLDPAQIVTLLAVVAGVAAVAWALLR